MARLGSGLLCLAHLSTFSPFIPGLNMLNWAKREYEFLDAECSYQAVCAAPAWDSVELEVIQDLVESTVVSDIGDRWIEKTRMG